MNEGNWRILAVLVLIGLVIGSLYGGYWAYDKDRRYNSTWQRQQQNYKTGAITWRPRDNSAWVFAGIAIGASWIGGIGLLAVTRPRHVPN